MSESPPGTGVEQCPPWCDPQRCTFHRRTDARPGDGGRAHRSPSQVIVWGRSRVTVWCEQRRGERQPRVGLVAEEAGAPLAFLPPSAVRELAAVLLSLLPAKSDARAS